MISTQRAPIVTTRTRRREDTISSLSKHDMSRIRVDSVASSLNNSDEETNHHHKLNITNSFNSLFSSFSVFSSQSTTSTKDTVPRTVSVATIPTIEQTLPPDNLIPQTKIRTIVDVPLEQPTQEIATNAITTKRAHNEIDQLPIFMTFTNHGRCTLDSNLVKVPTSSSESVISTISKTDPNKISKSMVQFVYGPESTQIGLTPLPLNLPTQLRDIEPNCQPCPDKNGLYSIRLTPFLESMSATTKSILFSPIVRTVGPNSQLVICRSTRYVQQVISNVNSQYHPIIFDSNSISRIHGYLKVDQFGNWYIQDVKSASGTFLNHDRLSKSSTISNDFILQNGDIIQLGMTPDDEETRSANYKCVRIKVELNDSWKLDKVKLEKVATERLTNLVDPKKNETCSICLYPCKPCQSIFLAPCAHCWHFNCIKPLMFKNYPHFVCPNCRAIIDLEEERSDEEEDDDNDD